LNSHTLLPTLVKLSQAFLETIFISSVSVLVAVVVSCPTLACRLSEQFLYLVAETGQAPGNMADVPEPLHYVRELVLDHQGPMEPAASCHFWQKLLSNWIPEATGDLHVYFFVHS
jgi:hypothetical protein